MNELATIAPTAASCFIAWAMLRLVRQLDAMEGRMRQAELEIAGIKGRIRIERAADLADARP